MTRRVFIGQSAHQFSQPYAGGALTNSPGYTANNSSYAYDADRHRVLFARPSSTPRGLRAINADTLVEVLATTPYPNGSGVWSVAYGDDVLYVEHGDVTFPGLTRVLDRVDPATLTVIGTVSYVTWSGLVAPRIAALPGGSIIRNREDGAAVDVVAAVSGSVTASLASPAGWYARGVAASADGGVAVLYSTSATTTTGLARLDVLTSGLTLVETHLLTVPGPYGPYDSFSRGDWSVAFDAVFSGTVWAMPGAVNDPLYPSGGHPIAPPAGGQVFKLTVGSTAGDAAPFRAVSILDATAGFVLGYGRDDTTTPPLRQRQRDDGVGSGAPRMRSAGVRPSSRQRSIRQGWPGTYL